MANPPEGRYPLNMGVFSRAGLPSLLILCLGLTTVPGAASENGTSWPEMLGDSQHSSRSTDPAITRGNASTFGVHWMANLYNSDLGSPVVAFNSTLNKTVVYVGNQRADLYAIDASSGQIIWSANLGVNDKMEDTPMVAPDGSVWVGTEFNPKLYKVNGATGAVECSIASPTPIDASPMYATPPGGTGTVYWSAIDTNTNQGPTYAVNESTCGQIFSFTNYLTFAGVWTTPAFGMTASGEPLAIVGTADTDSTEYAIDAKTGSLVWDFQIANPPPSLYDIGDAATISMPGNNGFADGVDYFDTKHGDEYALDMTTGAQIWHFSIAPNQVKKAQSSRSSNALDGTTLVLGYGGASGFGGAGGVYSLNAVTGAENWQWENPDATEVLSSPAIIGPSGSEVVAFGDIGGAFRLLSLAGGKILYKYQTGNYITASPAEANGTVFISSADGFLYAYGPHGSNTAPGTTTITYPATQSKLQNPNGSVTITGTASASNGVNAVEIAVQQSGTSGPWFNAATGAYNSAPIRNEATLASPGAKQTKWSFSLPVPPAGATYEAFANTVNAGNVVNHGTVTSFSVAHSKSEPNVQLSSAYVAPGSSVTASSMGFDPGETVDFTLFGNVVAKATANSKGVVPKTTINIPAYVGFGPTSLTLTGEKSGIQTSATLFITNNWTQSGHDALHTAYEPHDRVITGSISVGNNTVLSKSWYFQSTAAVNGSPTVVDGVSYFGNDAGVLTAVVDNTGAPKWTYTTPSKAHIRTAPAINPGHSIMFTSTDGSLYELTMGGKLKQSIPIGGNLTSPVFGNGQIYVASDSGHLYDVSASSGTVVWSMPLSGEGHSTPAFDASANLVVAGDDSGAITAFDAKTGAQAWKVTTGGPVVAPPMIMNGTVYIGSGDGNFYWLAESNGAQQMQIPLSGPVVAGAAEYPSQFVTIGDSTGTIYEFRTTDGVLINRVPTNLNSPVVGMANVQGNIFAEMGNGLIGMVREDGPVPFGWSYQTGSTLATTPAIVDGTVYIGAGDGGEYAFTPQGASPLSKTRKPVISITDSNAWSCTVTP